MQQSCHNANNSLHESTFDVQVTNYRNYTERHILRTNSKAKDYSRILEKLAKMESEIDELKMTLSSKPWLQDGIKPK